MQTVAHEHSIAENEEIERLPSLPGLFFASILGALGGIALAMMLFGFAFREDIMPAVSEVMSSDEKKVVQQPAADAKSGPELSSEEYMNAYVWTTRVRLDDLGLGQSLKVSASDDGKIIIRGTLRNTHAGRYNIFKGWFQSRETYPALIDEVNFVKISGSFPKIKSVWLGNEPAVHLDNGKSAKVGSIFGDGWKIVEIGRMALKLERDGTVIEISYSES